MYDISALKDTVITKVSLAIHVNASSKDTSHENRPFHGFVMNDENAARDYYFEDGTVLKTGANDLFYLPKGSSYSFKSRSEKKEETSCYAINFDADFESAPFVLTPRDAQGLRKLFKAAAKSFKSGDDFSSLFIRKTVYDIILFMKDEHEKEYMPEAKELILSPALTKIENCFTENNISVRELAALCGISEAYFRRLYKSKFGISPKEEITRRRIEHAKKLLSSGEISVKDAALLCGYAEPCHFSREFSRAEGMSPREWASERHKETLF